MLELGFAGFAEVDLGGGGGVGMGVTREEKKAMTHSTGDIMPPVSDGAAAREGRNR